MNTNRLEELIERFPGIGKRQAARIVLYLIQKGPSFAKELANELQALHSNIKQCAESFQYFESPDSFATTSPIVRDPSRNQTELLVVEKDLDISHFESAGYKGQYFVLGGLLPLRNKTKYNHIVRIPELLKHIEKKSSDSHLDASQKIKEVIIGLSYNPESEHTRKEIESLLMPLCEEYGFKVSSLGRGMSVGSEVEYADGATLQFALKNRA